ncbi:MAG TPA: phosphate acyltransferase PlsX [Candidatus Binatia bacterium]|nr:phosphate acyltransferase PlsX [Candidatus Binatia bacterium]
MSKIAVDAMGGDHAPGVVVEGALLAAQRLGVDVALVGQKNAIERELARHSANFWPVDIVHAPEVVGMDESPSSALRKKESSLKLAFEMVKRGEAQAVVSAGNSGAMMATGMFVLGRLPEVARPAILIVVPGAGKGTVIIDAGANVDCKPLHLVQFGLMGSIYAERVLGIVKPRVGVLSNGEEEGKGNELTRAASEQLATTSVNYTGYVEGRDIFNGKADVIVCDGFTGNIALKTMEGTAAFAAEVLKQAFQASLSSRLGYLMSRHSLSRELRRLDYAEYGGAPLLGLNGVAIVAHGGSNPPAIKNAIRAAHEALQQNVNGQINEALAMMDAERQKGKFPRNVWQRIKSKIDSLGDKSVDEAQKEEVKRGGEK